MLEKSNIFVFESSICILTNEPLVFMAVIALLIAGNDAVQVGGESGPDPANHCGH